VAVDEIRLRGDHNVENAMAAAAVTLARGVDPGAVRAGLARFAGVAHRLEEVARVDGVLYVDDSKATNVASAVVGIRSFPGGVHAILGGRGKGEDYAPLAAVVAERCRAAYLIGEEAAALHRTLAPTGVPLSDQGDLEQAVAAARAAAAPGEVVLLSPACASYDQYRSFEERGRHFKQLVRG
jgi:UDP-N-acetylmuramoylalanine--D-glutamate ligase